MGELSKTSGEIGEKLSKALIELIGWKHSTDNVSVPCHVKAHSNSAGKQRSSHGEDRIFVYNSPFHDDQTMVVHISVKHSFNPAPTVATLRRKFKEYHVELQETIECSALDAGVHQQIQARRPRKNISHVGVLIWRFGDANDRNILGDLAALELPSANRYPVFLLENSRQEFLFSVVNDFRTRAKDEVPNFYYPNLGTKLGVDDRRRGTILPIELASSGVIPILRQNDHHLVLYIYADQEFTRDSYRQLINYAFLMNQDFVSEIRIGMSNYDPARHAADATTARAFFSRREENVVPFSFSSRSASLLEEETGHR